MAIRATIDVKRVRAEIAPISGTHGQIVPIGMTSVTGRSRIECDLFVPNSGDPGAGTGMWTDADYFDLVPPEIGHYGMRIVTPRVIELRRVNTKLQGAARVTNWDFVDESSGVATLPPGAAFSVTDSNGVVYSVARVGFRRRPIVANVNFYDLRVDNSLFLELSSDLADGVTVTVENPNRLYLPADTTWKAIASNNRYGPALHVNQEGYGIGLPKKAMVGFWAGTLGELDVQPGTTFLVLNAATEQEVYRGPLVSRPESTAWNYTPAIYSKVLMADFGPLDTPGAYVLRVNGLGTSVTFRINEGIPLGFLRTYALGLYHQRCGSSGCVMPHTRHTHGPCHMQQAKVPIPAAEYAFTWNLIQEEATANRPATQTAPTMSATTMLFPYAQPGPIDVSGGHHDAGDYSRYMTNCAALVHYLVFTADNLPGAKELDNLGLPESGDGKSDILAEAKYEADFIAKMQDTDGGFYFLVYPRERRYEGDVTPDNSVDELVVWPKTAHSTAAAVAALAQIASSPTFRAQFGNDVADAYLVRAKAGYLFLKNAIAIHGGIDAIFQPITHYGAFAQCRDELAWAACEMWLATKNREDYTSEEKAGYHADLMAWFPNPLDRSEWTALYGWDTIFAGWGCAARSYAFGARSGRVLAGDLNASYLSLMEQALVTLGEDEAKWCRQTAYATSFPYESKRFRVAGWYFALNRACDIAVANLISPKPEYIDAIVGNLNYEAGCNPVNQSYLTGMGRRRQSTIVHQWMNTDDRVLPAPGFPIGSVNQGFAWLWWYGSDLGNLTFPKDSADPTYPMYDRWSDVWTVSQEFVCPEQAKSILALAALLPYVSSKSDPWKSGSLTIIGPTTVPLGRVRNFEVVSNLDHHQARVLWEVTDHEPYFGSVFEFAPDHIGSHRIEAEVQFPDGRRMFARTWVNVIDAEYVIEGGTEISCRVSLKHQLGPIAIEGVAHIEAERDTRILDCLVEGTSIISASLEYVEQTEDWINGALMTGSYATAAGGDTNPWTFGTTNPLPRSDTTAWHESAGVAPEVLHRHGCGEANPAKAVAAGDTLFAWIYIDPANMPSSIMVIWYGAFGAVMALWGLDQAPISSWGEKYSGGGIPPSGQWVRLTVPVAAVGMAGSTVNGIEFLMIGGHAWWGTAGRVVGRT